MGQENMGQGSGNFKKMRVLIGMPEVSKASEVVIGRSLLVDSLWRQLESGSLRLLSERRMGKTWTLTLARAKAPGWAVPLFIDAEGIKSAPEFVMRINKELHRNGLIPPNWWNTVLDWFRRWNQRLQGKKIASIEIPELDPWTSLLEDTCHKLADKSEGKRVILMIDELPYFLDKVMKGRGLEEATEILDQLRALRHSLPSLRMVFCGSLGLHVILKRLKEGGYTGSPVNDMLSFELPPLAPEDACYLAGCLLLGQGVKCTDLKAVAGTIAEASSFVPFYIQHLVNWIRDQETHTWTPDEAVSIPKQFFNSPAGDSAFTYYNEHLANYYPDDIVEKARAALDVLSLPPEVLSQHQKVLSQHQKGLPFNTLLNLVRHRPKTVITDPETFRDVMGILKADHYVIEQNDQWQFKLEIVRQWWYEARGRLAL
jgi:hypothetical protein